MRHYTHLTLLPREKISILRASGSSITDIAKELGVHKSTVSRELRRNLTGTEYIPMYAQKKYIQRRRSCRPHKHLEDPKLLDTVKSLFLEHQWSPEEISGRLAAERHRQVISYNTIYRAIYAHMFDDKSLSNGNRGVIRKLRHKGKSRHTKNYHERRGQIRISHTIDERPRSAENRSRKGHWEADTVLGQAGKACLVTLVDRKTRFLIGGKASGKKAVVVNTVIMKVLKGQPLLSITPDKGVEFAKHAEVTKVLQVEFYFPPARQPWKRASNENTNRLLREYFPKEKDITDIPEKYVQKVIDELNHRPRKCLGYKTPYEVYFSTMLHLT